MSAERCRKDASGSDCITYMSSPAKERVKESMFSFRTARGHPAHADEFRSNLTRWTCRYACPRPLDGLMGGDAVASGRLRPQAVRSHQIIGERMQECNRRAFDKSANSHEAEAMVLAVSVEPLDQLAELVNGLPRRTRHPTAPFLDAVGFAPPFAFSVPQRCRDLGIVGRTDGAVRKAHDAGLGIAQRGLGFGLLGFILGMTFRTLFLLGLDLLQSLARLGDPLLDLARRPFPRRAPPPRARIRRAVDLGFECGKPRLHLGLDLHQPGLGLKGFPARVGAPWSRPPRSAQAKPALPRP